MGVAGIKHIEVRHRHGKLTPRARNMHLVGYNTNNMTYRIRDPERPQEITNSGEVSFREKSARDVGRPKAGYDPFPDPSTVFVPRVETYIEAKKNNDKNLRRSQLRHRNNSLYCTKATGKQGICFGAAMVSHY